MKIVLSRTFHLISLVFFICVFGCVFLDYIENQYYIQITAGFCLTVIALLIFMLFKKHENRISAKTAFMIFIGIEFLMLAIQLIIMFNMGFSPVSDVEYVDTAAKNFAYTGGYEGINIMHGKTRFYFSNYPNNWGILVLLSFVYRVFYLVFGYIPSYTSQILNLICIHISGILLYFTSRLIFKDRIRPLFCSAMFMLSPAFYTNALVFYTDTLSTPFVIGSVFLFLKAIKSKKISSFAVYTAAAAVVFGLGYCFKGSLAVLIIAFAMFAFVKIGWKKALCLTGTLIISVFSFSASVRQIGLNLGISDQKLLERYEMPATHWIDMSLSGNGRFNLKEKNKTLKFETLDKRNSECKKSIKVKLQNYGISGTLKHSLMKITNTWNNGTFYGRYLDESKNTSLRYSLTEGRKMDMYSKAMQIFLLTMILFSFIYGTVHSRISFIALIRLCVFGFALFFVIWEIKPRYLINFLPLMFIICADGINYLNGLVSCMLKKFRRRKCTAQ